jgi:hypothetical protein
MNDLEIRDLCAALLLKELGRLDDISAELANTVANVYYRFIELGNSGMASFNSMRQASEYPAELAKILSDYEIAKRMVGDLRRLRNEAHSSVAEAAEELYISSLKYNVPFDENKSLMRMKAERLLYRHKVKEIPDLVHELGLR